MSGLLQMITGCLRKGAREASDEARRVKASEQRLLEDARNIAVSDQELVDRLVAHLRCYNIPIGSTEGQKLIVKVHEIRPALGL